MLNQMEWATPRGQLNPAVSDFEKFGHTHDTKITPLARTKILSGNKYTCRYCGGHYMKYMICTVIDYQNDIVDSCCRLCNSIRNLNICQLNGNEIDIYYSKMSQLDIVRKTVTYIVSNQMVPDVSSIDPNVQLAPISVFEYVNTLIYHKSDPKTLDILANYKIFFRFSLNIDFIVCNFETPVFINDNDNDNDNDNTNANVNDTASGKAQTNKHKKVPMHKMSNREIKLFNDTFGQPSPATEIKK